MSNNPGKAIAKQPWDAKRVGNLLLNNALFILMFIAIIYIAIRNPNFIKQIGRASCRERVSLQV